jgi:hypothetical protein
MGSHTSIYAGDGRSGTRGGWKSLRRIASIISAKHGVIAGTVVDDAGEPVVGVAVRALIKNVVAGRTVVGQGHAAG